MPDGDTFVRPGRTQHKVGFASDGERTLEFDGDVPLSEMKAAVTDNVEMKAEIHARRLLIAMVNDLAFLSDGKGYRRVAALLLEAADTINRALIADTLPASSSAQKRQGHSVVGHHVLS